MSYPYLCKGTGVFKMNRRELLKAAGWMTCGSLAALGQSAPRQSKPNIIFVLADDLGIDGLSCYGADQAKTPNIDRLARGGTRYTNAYTAPLCGPSRALILMGRYAFRTGGTNQDAVGQIKPEAETLLPKVLKTAGYTSTMVGKWGQLPSGPAEFGFDDHLKFTGSGVYWNTQERGKFYIVNGERKPLRDKEYLPDLMHNHLVDFMTRNRNNPFFAYYSMSHVHGEILPTPDSEPDSGDLYNDNTIYMDKLVGKLVSELDRLKLRENTIIVFFGDNGTAAGGAAQSTVRGRRLSGQKGSMLEGGALVPLIVNWPGRTPAGKVSSDLVDSTDFLPTFADLADAKLPVSPTLDGHNQAPLFLGKKAPARQTVFIQLARQWYVRDAKWKLNQDGSLFDMSDAPFTEPIVAPDTKDAASVNARARLQATLEKLNPAAGILDQGDGTGRHSNREENRKKKKKQ